MTEITWKELRNRARTVPQKLSLELAVVHLASDPCREFVGLVRQGISWATRELARSKNLIGNMTEDQLTTLLLAPLIGAGFSAYHDVNVGGHCDIYIEFEDGNFWLGEAKKHSDYGYLLGGFRQLVDRYSTGLAGQDDGGLIIYIFNKDAKSVMEAWLAYLQETTATISCEFDKQTLIGRSEHQHAGSGRSITVGHYPAVLYHSPTDTLAAPKRIKL